METAAGNKVSRSGELFFLDVSVNGNTTVRGSFLSRLLWLSLVIAALFALIINAARLGPGISSDSVAYASAARSFAEHDSLVDFSGQALTTFPPGLPILLGIFVKSGLDLQTASVILNLVCAGTAVWLAYTLASEFLGSLFLGLVVASVFGFSVSTVKIYSMLWSESVFCALTLLILLLLMRAIQSARISIPRLCTICALVSISTLFRYIGVILIPLTIVGVFLSLRGQRPHRALRPCLWALMAGGISSLGFLFLAYRNRTLGVGTMGTRYPSDFHPFQVLATGLYALGGLLIPTQTTIARVLLGFILMVVMLRGTWEVLRSGCLTRTFLASFIACYLLALIYSEMTTVLDAIDDRLLAPAFAPMIILVLDAIREAKRKANARKGILWARRNDAVLAVCLFLFLIWTIDQSVGFSVEAGREGIGLNERSYRDSPLAKAVSVKPVSEPVASTDPEMTYWLSQRTPILRIPRLDHYFPPERTRYDFTKLNHARYFAFVAEDTSAVTPEEVEKNTGLRLRLSGVFRDGRLYEAVQ